MKFITIIMILFALTILVSANQYLDDFPTFDPWINSIKETKNPETKYSYFDNFNYFRKIETGPILLLANSELTTDDPHSAMCGKIKVDPSFITTNVTTTMAITVKGYIDDIYKTECTSSSECEVSLQTWTANHNFKYVISTNTDVYITYDMSSNLCGSVAFYSIFTISLTIGIIIICCIIALLITCYCMKKFC